MGCAGLYPSSAPQPNGLLLFVRTCKNHTQTTSQLHRQKRKQNTAPQITNIPKRIRPIVPVRKQIGKMLLVRAKLFLRLDLKVLLVLVLLVVIGVCLGRYGGGRRQ
jgi:hypothetical protein